MKKSWDGRGTGFALHQPKESKQSSPPWIDVTKALSLSLFVALALALSVPALASKRKVRRAASVPGYDEQANDFGPDTTVTSLRTKKPKKH